MTPADLNPLDLTARLGLPMEATPAQIAPLLGGEHDTDARREYAKALAYADERFELACSYAALLEVDPADPVRPQSPDRLN